MKRKVPPAGRLLVRGDTVQQKNYPWVFKVVLVHRDDVLLVREVEVTTAENAERKVKGLAPITLRNEYATARCTELVRL